MGTFDDYIKERSHQNENGLNIITTNEVMGAWHEYMRELQNIYELTHGDMKQAGTMVQVKLKEWKIL